MRIGRPKAIQPIARLENLHLHCKESEGTLGKNFGPPRARYLGNIGKVISHVSVEGIFGFQGMLWP
jgi:hypothetical protein